jgi:hypothetical protein
MRGTGLCAQHPNMQKARLDYPIRVPELVKRDVAGIGERNGVPFRFITYTLYAVPMMVVSIAISHVYVWWRYF